MWEERKGKWEEVGYRFEGEGARKQRSEEHSQAIDANDKENKRGEIDSEQEETEWGYRPRTVTSALEKSLKSRETGNVRGEEGERRQKEK